PRSLLPEAVGPTTAGMGRFKGRTVLMPLESRMPGFLGARGCPLSFVLGPSFLVPHSVLLESKGHNRMKPKGPRTKDQGRAADHPCYLSPQERPDRCILGCDHDMETNRE